MFHIRFALTPISLCPDTGTVRKAYRFHKGANTCNSVGIGDQTNHRPRSGPQERILWRKSQTCEHPQSANSAGAEVQGQE